MTATTKFFLNKYTHIFSSEKEIYKTLLIFILQEEQAFLLLLASTSIPSTPHWLCWLTHLILMHISSHCALSAP